MSLQKQRKHKKGERYFMQHTLTYMNILDSQDLTPMQMLAPKEVYRKNTLPRR